VVKDFRQDVSDVFKGHDMVEDKAAGDSVKSFVECRDLEWIGNRFSAGASPHPLTPV